MSMMTRYILIGTSFTLPGPPPPSGGDGGPPCANEDREMNSKTMIKQY